MCIVNVYVPCCRVEKRRLWDLLAVVAAQSRGISMCIIGDLNSILVEGERVGIGGRDDSGERKEFRAFVEGSGLIDVPLQGRKFTCYKSDGSCKSRIDRALINERWAETWRDTGLRGLPRSISDHCAIVLQTMQVDWGPIPFRFVNAWISHPQYREVVEASWRDEGIVGWGSYVFKEKLKRLKEVLKVWNRDHFGNMDANICRLREEINDLDERDDEGGLSEEEALRRRVATAHLILQLKNKKSLLAQKARMRWLKEGDVNSKTFHRAIIHKRHSNRLLGLEIEGEWSEDPGRVKGAVRDYFRNLFSRKASNLIELPEDLFQSKLVDADRAVLTEAFSEDEIRNAVWECEGAKSPGPDGFGFEFYKKSWEVIKGDLLRVFSEFHSNGKLARGCNSSFIALIPKKEGAGNLSQFRPISLIGSLYKLLATVLAKRLKKVIGKLIGENQSAFIKNRFILDGVVVLNEAIEDAKFSKAKRMFFKVDFAKAFDSISWEYLLDVKRKMNFPEKWVKWIFECISTARANVLVNGSPSGEFALERGLR